MEQDNLKTEALPETKDAVEPVETVETASTTTEKTDKQEPSLASVVEKLDAMKADSLTPKLKQDQKAAPDKGRTERTENDSDFTPIAYKANGKEYKIENKQELLRQLAAAKDSDTYKSQLQKAYNEKTAAYRDFEQEINKDHDFAQVIGILYNKPEMRKAFLSMYNEGVKRGSINPA